MSARAGYIAQGEHVRTPGALLGIEAVVANPSLDPFQLRSVCDPGASLLGAFNAQAVSLAGPTNAYYMRLRTDMTPFILKRADGAWVESSQYKLAYFDWRILAGARAYAQWTLTNWPFALYLDELVAEIPLWIKADLPAELSSALVAAWPAFRDALVDEIRFHEPERIVTGNTAGWMDRRLNGICIEKSHADRMGTVMALARYVIQWTGGKKPALSIDFSGGEFTGRFELPPLGVYKCKALLV